MNDDNKKVLLKRTKSYLWRLGGMVLVALLSFVAQQAQLLELPNFVVVLLGLVVGEVTKAVKVDLPKLQELLKK